MNQKSKKVLMNSQFCERRLVFFARPDVPSRSPETPESLLAHLDEEFVNIYRIHDEMNASSNADVKLNCQRQLTGIQLRIAPLQMRYRQLAGTAYVPPQREELPGASRKIRLEFTDYPDSTASFTVTARALRQWQVSSWFSSGGVASEANVVPLLDRIIRRRPDAVDGQTRVYRVNLGALTGVTQNFEQRGALREAVGDPRIPLIPAHFLQVETDTQFHNLEAGLAGIKTLRERIVGRWATLSEADRKYEIAHLRTVMEDFQKILLHHRAQDAVQVLTGVRTMTVAQSQALGRLLAEWKIGMAAVASADLHRVVREVQHADGSVDVWRAVSSGQWQGMHVNLDGSLQPILSPAAPPENPVRPTFKPFGTHTLDRIPRAPSDYRVKITFVNDAFNRGKSNGKSLTYNPYNQTFEGFGADVAAQLGIAFEPLFSATERPLGVRAVHQLKIHFLKPGGYDVNGAPVDIEPPSYSDVIPPAKE